MVALHLAGADLNVKKDRSPYMVTPNRPLLRFSDMPAHYPLRGELVQARSLSRYLTATFWYIRRTITLRRVLLLVATSTVFFALLILWSGVPPTLIEIRDYEENLPQHNLAEAPYDKSFDPARRRKYLRVEGAAQGVGINNVLQQLFHLTYLAHESGRAFVFEDYIWSHLPFRYTIDNYALRPTRIPLNAFTSGAFAGGTVPSNYSRSISVAFFDQICPEKSRVVIEASQESLESNFRNGLELVSWWLDRLRAVEDEPCVVIRSSQNFQVFDWRNFALLKPSDPLSLLDVSSSTASSAPVLKELVAVHLRRGDFKGHCRFLCKNRNQYSGYNKLEILPDRLDTSDNSVECYHKHCYPDIEQIVEKLDQVRNDAPGLRRVFLLSNGSRWWLYRLAQKLKESGWDDVVDSNDLRLDAWQKQVSGTVDMAIAEKAEVFVGNGTFGPAAHIGMSPDVKLAVEDSALGKQKAVPLTVMSLHSRH
ncbi:hypothetical protein V5O48_014931 [Marasmius crinis-equi]|uniref:Uncharacterized protein n=1 Tax=Marasmius crinis-equi TaxID=585013 RepID=A0ABR3EW87_9AGAR